jgi:hypothetical protein
MTSGEEGVSVTIIVEMLPVELFYLPDLNHSGSFIPSAIKYRKVVIPRKRSASEVLLIPP